VAATQFIKEAEGKLFAATRRPFTTTAKPVLFQTPTPNQFSIAAPTVQSDDCNAASGLKFLRIMASAQVQYFQFRRANVRSALLVFAVLLFVLVAGCVSARMHEDTPASAAKRYAVEQFGFTRPKVERVDPTPTGYEVIVWDQPYQPGGNLILVLSKDLRLVRWNGLR
jgi:hypothetical protein